MLKRLLFIPFLLLLSSPAWSAVTFDTFSTSTEIADDILTHNHTFAATANLAVVIVGIRDGASSPVAVSSVTVGGQAATLVPGCAINASPTTVRVEMWALVSPPTGVQSVSADASGGGGTNDEMAMSVLSFIGAATSNTFGTCVTLGATTAAVDLNSIGSAVGEMGVLGLAANAGPTCSADATSPVSTERTEVTVPANITNCSYTEDGAATSINMLVDLGTSQRVAAVAVSIRAQRTGGAQPIFME